jgi:hypothetical protein
LHCIQCSVLKEASRTMSSQNIKTKITDLPVELLVLIFKHCCYREVAENIRPVCRKFYNAAALVLNSEFCTLGRKIHRTMVAVEQNMMRTQTESQFQVLSQTFNTLEIVKSRVSSLSDSLLRLVFSKSKLHVPKPSLGDINTETWSSTLRGLTQGWQPCSLKNYCHEIQRSENRIKSGRVF